MSHSTNKLRRETLLCFTKLLVSKTFMDKGGGQGGSITIFFQKIFCLPLTKNFIGEHFRVSIVSGTEKACEQEGEGVSGSSVESFCLTVPKDFVGDHFSVS